MKKDQPFDPCRSLRSLIEALYANGKTREALLLSRCMDAVQLRRWAADEAKSA